MTEASLPGNAGPRGQKTASLRTRERRRFRTALLLSGLAHAIVILLLLALWQSIPDATQPLMVVPIKLVQEPVGRSGAAGGGTGTTAASAPNAGAEAETQAAQPPSAQPAEEAQPQQSAQAQSPPQPEAPAAPEALRLPPSPAATRSIPIEQRAAPVPPRKPIPPHPRPRRLEPRREALGQARPMPLPPVPTVPQVATTMPTASSTSAAPQGTALPLPPGIGGQGRGDEGTGKAAIGNGSDDGTADDYLARVWRWILQFRQPPHDDCSNHQGSGTIEVTFLRNGTVTDARVVQSSGCPGSDAEALRMVHAASPLPPIPPRFPGAERTIKIPFDFRPGFFDRLFHGF